MFGLEYLKLPDNTYKADEKKFGDYGTEQRKREQFSKLSDAMKSVTDTANMNKEELTNKLAELKSQRVELVKAIQDARNASAKAVTDEQPINEQPINEQTIVPLFSGDVNTAVSNNMIGSPQTPSINLASNIGMKPLFN